MFGTNGVPGRVADCDVTVRHTGARALVDSIASGSPRALYEWTQMSTQTASRDATSERGPVGLLLTNFGFQILLALVLGIVLGWWALALGPDSAGNPNGLAATVGVIGSAYVTLLKAAVVPLIFAAIVASITTAISRFHMICRSMRCVADVMSAPSEPWARRSRSRARSLF